MLVLHACLLLCVPDKDLVVIRVAGDDSSILRPAFEAVDLSRVDENLADLQFCLLPLQLLLIRTAILTWVFVRVNCKSAPSLVLLYLVAWVCYVDFSHGKEGSGSTNPLLVVVFVIIGVLVCPCSEIDRLPHASGMRLHCLSPATAAY
jgi:hypothetical protein